MSFVTRDDTTIVLNLLTSRVFFSSLLWSLSKFYFELDKCLSYKTEKKINQKAINVSIKNSYHNACYRSLKTKCVSFSQRLVLIELKRELIYYDNHLERHKTNPQIKCCINKFLSRHKNSIEIEASLRLLRDFHRLHFNKHQILNCKLIFIWIHTNVVFIMCKMG